MKIAVVTPYYREADDVLRACLDSVRDQIHAPCRHFLVSDGFPNALVDSYDATHIRLPNAHGDNGNLGRCIGAFTAISEGYDAIAFLDADNWFRPDHIARMVALHARTGAAICTSGRSIHRLDGSLLLATDQESDGFNFADTSCLCIFRPAFDLMALWGMMPREAGPICDRLMWDAVKMRDITHAHDPEPTMGFRSQYRFHYMAAGDTPPPNAKADEVAEAARQFVARPYTSRIGLLLGLGGAEDVPALAAVRAQPESAAQSVQVQGFGQSLTLAVPQNDNARAALLGVYQEQWYRPVPGLPAPRAVLDIGANIGLAAAYFRMAFPSAPIMCVEPDPKAFELLLRNAAVIGNCQAIRVAVHHGTQTRSFPVGAPTGSGEPEQSTRLLMIDAESLVGHMGEQNFDLVKISTGGSDVPILMALRGRLAKMMTVMVTFHNDADRRLLDAMLSETHALWSANRAGPDMGTLCYIGRSFARDLPPSLAPA